MNVVFFGSSLYVLPILEGLKKNSNLCLVITTEKSQTQPVPKYCIENKIPYFSVSSSLNSNLKSSVLNHQSPIGVVADFGLIMPENILNLFPKGILNIHPSLLPKYRGPTPVQTAILEGEKVTGVSIMKLDEEIDHGPILAQTKEQISENDTAESLYERLFKKGAEILVPIIRIIELNQPVPEIPQDHSKATFTKILTRQDGYIDLPSLEIGNWELEIARKIRAYYPWPGVWTKWKMEDGRWKTIKFLPDKKIQVEGKKPISYKDFINGHPNPKQLHALLGRL